MLIIEYFRAIVAMNMGNLGKAVVPMAKMKHLSSKILGGVLCFSLVGFPSVTVN